FAPVQRLVELTGSGGAAADAFRAEGRSESLVVDGQTFPSSDYRGVVLARSEERQPFKRGVTVTRFRPTLLLRDRAFELGTFDGADEADARELGEAVASTLAGHPVKCPSVDWHVPTGPASVPALLAELLLFWTAMMGGLYVTASGRLPLWAGVRAAMVLVVAADVLNARLISRNAAQALSRKAEELIKSARPALSRAG
ncbi:MAG TPA: hypothetical protein VE987_17200, partial [Polyangiaceae bacterium]|nr:hypothetical protein [Polyangiaceae bacterium]